MRCQEKGESLRQLRMALRRLANETFKGLSPSEPWLVCILSSLFIIGLEDTTFSIELSTAWKTDMSLNDLFVLADVCTRKRVLLKTRTKAAGTSFQKLRIPLLRIPAGVEVVDMVVVVVCPQRALPKRQRPGLQL